MAWVKVHMPSDVISDADRYNKRRRLNIYVRDESPCPPRRCDGEVQAKVRLRLPRLR